MTRIYDTAKIWHFGQTTKKDKWLKALCGYYFEPAKRQGFWETCKACFKVIERDRSDTMQRLTSRHRKQIQVSEQRFEPPELGGF